ncbi:MAG: TrkH family potassium uptake protein [Bacteroidales bacterium]|nr:TrkH family potassium uptake protein [Clostridium sp.]MCM1203730.1 TrkH family potassium uptake protein [Bacteroidales bacterium]
MNMTMIFYLLGWILNIIATLMFLPFSVSLYYGEENGRYFLFCALIMLALGFGLTRKRPKNTSFYAKEGFVMTALSWLLLSFTGCLPFYFSGEIPSFTNALFECISGFTTTGASILSDVEAMSRCMMFWRCLTQWIGGMGVLVFMLALIPLAGGQDLYLMKAESPGPNVGKLAPKVQKTAYYLYAIYFALTMLEIICLVIAGAPLYDAVCTAFTTTSTGGFGVKNTSLGGYSPAIQYIVTVFLYLSGLNYNFFFFIWIKQFRDAFSMREIRLYSLIFFTSIAVIATDIILRSGYALEEGFRHAALQVGSIMTTAGFSSADFDTWPSLSKGILVLLMFIGGCAGSTCGGIKVSRILIYLKTIKKELAQLCHPRNVKVIKIDGKPLPHNVLRSANIFFITYIVIFAFSNLLISIDNYDLETTFTAVASALGNIGPGLSLVGPVRNFDLFSGFSKYVLMFDMLAGRLEIFPLLVLLAPSTWKKK